MGKGAVERAIAPRLQGGAMRRCPSAGAIKVAKRVEVAVVSGQAGMGTEAVAMASAAMGE